MVELVVGAQRIGGGTRCLDGCEHRRVRRETDAPCPRTRHRGACGGRAGRSDFARRADPAHDGAGGDRARRHQRVLDRVDINALLGRVDVGEIIRRVDVDEVVTRIDVTELISRVDVEPMIDRIDLNELVSKIDIDDVVERTEIGSLVVRSTSGVDEALDAVRSRAVGIDTTVTRAVDRLLRGGRRPVGPGRLKPDASV